MIVKTEGPPTVESNIGRISQAAIEELNVRFEGAEHADRAADNPDDRANGNYEKMHQRFETLRAIQDNVIANQKVNIDTLRGLVSEQAGENYSKNDFDAAVVNILQVRAGLD